MLLKLAAHLGHSNKADDQTKNSSRSVLTHPTLGDGIATNLHGNGEPSTLCFSAVPTLPFHPVLPVL